MASSVRSTGQPWSRTLASRNSSVRPEVRVALDVVADLLERAEQGAPARALRLRRRAGTCRGRPPGAAKDPVPARSAAVRSSVTSGATRSSGTLPPLKPSAWVTARRTAADAVAADGDGRVRRLEGPGPDEGPRHSVELAVELDGLLGPDRLQAGEELVGAAAALVEGHADRVVLVARPADAEPDVEAAPGDLVQRGELLRQHDRRVVGHDEDARAQTDARRHARHERERDHRIRHGLEGSPARLARASAGSRSGARPGRAAAGAPRASDSRDARPPGRPSPGWRAWPTRRTRGARSRASWPRHAAHDTRSSVASARPREGIMSPVLKTH